MSKKNNVEVVLPPSGSGAASAEENKDPKLVKQELKTKISSLKLELKTAEKELGKLSPTKKKSTVNNKTAIVVKKKKALKNK